MARTLCHDLGRRAGDRRGNVIGLLAVAAIAEQDIAILADRTGKGGILYADGQRALSVIVDHTDRREIVIAFIDLAAVGERAAFDLHDHAAALLVRNVHRSAVVGKGAVRDLDAAVGSRMNDRIREAGRLAAGQRRVERCLAGLAAAIHEEVVAVILAIDEIDVPHIRAVADGLAPDHEILRIIDVDRSLAVLGRRIRADGKILAAEIGVVGINGEVVRHIVMHAIVTGGDCRTGTANDQHTVRAGLCRRQGCLQRGGIAGLRASLPIHRRGGSPFRLADAGQRQGVIRRGQRGESSFKRAVGHTANRSDARCKHRRIRHGDGRIAVGIFRLLFVVPKAVAADGTGAEAADLTLGHSIDRDRRTTGHQAGIDLDGRLARNGRAGLKFRVRDRQVGAADRALVINEDRLTYAVERAVIEYNVLRTVSPDIVSVCAGLIERAAVEGLACSVQEHLTIDGAVVVHQRIGMLNTDIVAVGLIVEGHALEGDLRAVQRHRSRHIKRDIHAVRRFDGECFAGVGQAAIKRILIGSKDRDGLAVLDSRNGFIKRAIGHTVDRGDLRLSHRIVAVAVICNIKAFFAVVLRNLNIERTARDLDLIDCAATGCTDLAGICRNLLTGAVQLAQLNAAARNGDIASVFTADCHLARDCGNITICDLDRPDTAVLTAADRRANMAASGFDQAALDLD